MVDDPPVRLVWDVYVDVRDRLAALREHGLGGRHQHACREPEHLATVHLQHRLGVLERPRTTARVLEVDAASAVGAKLEAEEAAVRDRLEDDSTRAVAEQDERRAIVPVEDLREDVTADDERPSRQAGGEHAVGLGDRVHEPRAPGEQVVGGRLRHSELVRHQRGRRREHHVGSDRGADQEVDLARIHARVGERCARGGQRDVGQCLVLGGHPPLADAGALHDPLVRRVDVLREVVVRDHAVRDVHAEPGDPDPRAVGATDHVTAPLRTSACRVRPARRRLVLSPCRGRWGHGPGLSRTRATASRRGRRRA